MVLHEIVWKEYTVEDAILISSSPLMGEGRVGVSKN